MDLEASDLRPSSSSTAQLLAVVLAMQTAEGHVCNLLEYLDTRNFKASITDIWFCSNKKNSVNCLFICSFLLLWHKSVQR